MKTTSRAGVRHATTTLTVRRRLSDRFLKKSISLPIGLGPHIARKLRDPATRHSFSTYVTNLILDDKERDNTAAAA